MAKWNTKLNSYITYIFIWISFAILSFVIRNEFTFEHAVVENENECCILKSLDLLENMWAMHGMLQPILISQICVVFWLSHRHLYLCIWWILLRSLDLNYESSFSLWNMFLFESLNRILQTKHRSFFLFWLNNGYESSSS